MQIHPDQSQLGQKLAVQGLVDQMVHTEVRGEDYVRSALLIESIGWYLVAEVPEDELYQAIDDAVFDNIIFGIIVAFVWPVCG